MPKTGGGMEAPGPGRNEEMPKTGAGAEIPEGLTGVLEQDNQFLRRLLQADKSFDMVDRALEIGGRKAHIFFVDGLCKDELLQKLLQYFLDLKQEDMPEKIEQLSAQCVPYIEVSTEKDPDAILYSVLAGIFLLVIDGYDQVLLLDAREYPARSVSEPEKDKTLRGSRDGFVETLIFNTALLRRRIRDPQFHVEIHQVGKTSRTDVALCYVEGRADDHFLQRIRERLESIQVDALTMSQESLAECLFTKKWYNPFPKFKHTERPDAATAQLLGGNLVILVDNAPSALIMPTTVFDVMEEADDYYFPPVTGSYLRLSRMLIALVTYLWTPLFLLLIQNPDRIPAWLSFIELAEESHVPLILQFLILEFAIDGLRLAAVNTPNMLSTPLSVLAGIVMGEYAVESGWFNAEVLLYMAVVALASYTQPNYEMGYALKFMRMITLILTALFGGWGFAAGILILFAALLLNKSVSGNSYLYPLIPFDWPVLKRLLVRRRLWPEQKER
ncbi:MAG: spore germination protein [Lachnospiraceae bacterium]|nr:spore germination protein [Lachnospiraceae bacterium]